MTIWNILVISISIVLTAVSYGNCSIKVDPDIVGNGEQLSIKVTVGTKLNEPTTATVTCSGKDGENIEFKFDNDKFKYENAKITFNAPRLEKSGKCTIAFANISGNFNFTVYSRNSPYIKEAVLWKKERMSDTAILGHISKVATHNLDAKVVSPPVFDGVSILGDELTQLREAGFSEDFITKLEGQPQWVTLGMAAIFLPDGGKVTTAPLLRIMLEPKSYYKPRYPFGSLIGNLFHLRPEFFSILRQKFDVNIGYTVITAKTDSENANFLLAGFSYEINPSALLNFGAAIPTGSVKDKSVTSYVGVTVDQNFLKAIGLME